jgi:glycosyltransferase involved in cell wall biosynthesis
MPMTALEASALGVPLVAHAVGGLTSVVPQEFLVHQHDATGYKAGVLRALRADGRAIAMEKAESTLNKFSAQRNAERIRALYEQLIERTSTRENDRCV